MAIARKSIMAGVRKSHERVMILCAECGEEFETSHNMENTWLTCPACTLANRKERDEERREEERQKKSKRWDGTRHVMAQAYTIDFDPENGWGYQSILSIMEVNALLMVGNFCIGTRLKRGGKLFIVKRNVNYRAKARQCLEEFEV